MSDDKTILNRLKFATCVVLLLVATIGWFAALVSTFNMEGHALGKAGSLLGLVFIFAYAMTYIPFPAGGCAGGSYIVPPLPPVEDWIPETNKGATRLEDVQRNGT